MDLNKKEKVKIKLKNTIEKIKKNRAILLWAAQEKYESGRISVYEYRAEIRRIYEMTDES